MSDKTKMVKKKLICKPCKGWRFRVVVFDEHGNIRYDDVNNPGVACRVAMRMVISLIEQRPY